MASYANPFSLPGAPFASLADPTLLWHEGRCYLFVTAHQAWSSVDLVSWDEHAVQLPKKVVAPALVEHKGTFYLSGNGAGIFEAPHPLGPWRYAGDVETVQGSRLAWADPMFFVDDDQRVYAYHNVVTGVGTDGVYVTELDPSAGLRRARSETRHCFAYVHQHRWERWGDANEFSEVAWIEAPWMTKHRGRYYLQYSGAGTEWRTYAIGLYTSESPLGPFVYDERSPLLRQRVGLLVGTGHHALVRGPKGGLYNFYHVLFRNGSRFDRRLALDRADFDDEGHLVLAGPSETPQPFPDEEPGAARDLGWLPLCTDKPVRASSAAPGRDPEHAVDQYVRTWWQAADASWPQWLEVDLLGSFVLRAFRVIFAPTQARGVVLRGSCAYRIEASADGARFDTIFEVAPGDDRDIQYYEFKTASARKVRIMMMGGYEGAAAGIIDFSVFGEDGLEQRGA
jgi:hypothetical protein